MISQPAFGISLSRNIALRILKSVEALMKIFNKTKSFNIRLTQIVALLCMLVMSSLATTSSANGKSPTFVVVGTGDVEGIYHPIGAAVCRMTNQTRRETGIRCTTEKSAGSTANLAALNSGEIDLGIIQADSQHDAFHDHETNQSQKNLRTLLSLHTEQFTVVARAGSNIHTFDDLKGKRISVGRFGSGHRKTLDALMDIKGWNAADFTAIHELPFDQQSSALCNSQIDAYVLAVGHPTLIVKETSNSCTTRILNMSDTDVDRLIKESEFYSKAIIPGGLYKGNNEDISTIGITTSLVASAKTEPKVVYQVVKSIFTNIGAIRKMHPAFKTMTTNTLLNIDASVPMHIGAVQFFEEQGFDVDSQAFVEEAAIAQQ